MRQYVLLLILVGSLLGVQAQSQSQLEGMVCVDMPYEKYEDECYSRGLSDATVTLTSSGVVAGVGSETYTQTTDDWGWFWFNELPDGDYTLTVTRTGFETAEQTVSLPSQNSVAVHMVPLEVEAAIQVVGDEPVAKARVSVSSDSDYHELQTDANGVAEFTTLAGWHWAYVEAPGHHSASMELLIDGSGEHTISIEPFPPQTSKVQGVIRDQDGNPVADVQISTFGNYYYEDYGYPEHGYAESEPRPMSAPDEGGAMIAPYPCCGNQNWTTSDATGRYSMHVAAGDVSLSFQKEGYASKNKYVYVDKDETVTEDIELLKFPDKDATLKGKITNSAGSGLAFVSLDIYNPEFGIWSCGSFDQDYDDCDVTINKDGTFSGMVTPGYTTIRAYYQDWRACTESQDADGSFHRTCGPRYFSFVRTLELSSGSNTVNIQLVERPGPDATVSGYVVDQESGETVSGARVEFTNEATYGYGFAQTDRDGSYKVKLVSGYHNVRVYADGYLPWEGVLRLGANANAPLDIFLKEGEQTHGYGCCYAYAEGDVSYAGGPATPAASPEVPRESEDFGSDEGSEAEAIVDLNGGLGPYDADARKNYKATGDDSFTDASDKDSPGLGGIAILAAIGAAMVLSRRRQGAN